MRALASTAAVVRERAARAQLLTTLRTASEDAVAEALPILLHRSRGQARREVLRAIPSLYGARGPGAIECYALLGALRRTTEARARKDLSSALLRAEESAVDTCVLALQIAGKIPALRDAHAPLPALELLERARGTTVAWDEEQAVSLREGTARSEVQTAALFATAGGGRASGALLRRWVVRGLERGGSVGAHAVSLARWLALEAVGRAEVPAWASDPDWWGLCALVLARASLERAGPAAALEGAVTSSQEGAFAVLLAQALVRAVARVADAGDEQALRALRAQSLALATRAKERALAPVVCVFLAAPGLEERERGALVGASLASEERSVLEAALESCEVRGVPAGALPALRALASSHVLASVRERARLLVRSSG